MGRETVETVVADSSRAVAATKTHPKPSGGLEIEDNCVGAERHQSSQLDKYSRLNSTFTDNNQQQDFDLNEKNGMVVKDKEPIDAELGVKDSRLINVTKKREFEC